MPPVIEHPVHESGIRLSDARYGCFNRKSFQSKYVVMDRDVYTLESKLRILDFRMSTDCRYDKSLSDPKCFGCKHKGSGEAYDRSVREGGAA